jgi:hypothetical protein
MARRASTESDADNGGLGEEAWDAALAETFRAAARRTAPGPDCPEPDALARLAGLPAGARERDPLYAGHVALCGWCRGQVEALAAGLSEPDAGPSPAAPGAGRTAPDRWPFRWLAFPAAGAAALATAALMYVFAVAPAREAARHQAEARAAANAHVQRLEARQAATALPSASPSPAVPVHPAPSRPRPTPEASRIASSPPAAAPLPHPTPHPIPTGPTRVASASGEPGAVHLPDLSALVPRRGVVRGSDTSAPHVTLLAPLGTRVVSDRPAFSWQPFPGAHRYRVLVSYTDDNSVAEGEPVPADATTWTPSGDLPRGKVLAWEVHALDEKGGELAVSAEGRFGVVTEAQAASLRPIAAEYGAAALARAVALLNTGALADAETVLAPLTTDPSLTEAQRARAASLLSKAKAARRAASADDRGDGAAPATPGAAVGSGTE